MNIFSSIKEGIRNRMKSFLQLEKAQDLQIDILENMDEETRTIKNTIWYRGDAYELTQLYSQLPNKMDTFWGSTSTAGMEIRKIHTGLPSLIVDTLSNIIISDYNGIDFDTDSAEKYKDQWKQIEEENNFEDILSDSISQSLYKGAGAFKISFDASISKNPIIEYYPKDEIEIVKKRARVREIKFKNKFVENDISYVLTENYGYGYVTYELKDLRNNKVVSLDSTEFTKGLESIKFDGCEIDSTGEVINYGTFMLAIPFKIYQDSIYDKKTDSFDALDEAWSQWMNALRDGRSKTYIPESLLPKNPKTGEILMPNGFDDKYIRREDDHTEEGKNQQIDVVQPSIPTDSYMSTYITALDLALQGLISPSTLGIDTKKLTDPNAAFQREKEKTTLWTRGKIIDSLEKTIPKLVDLVFKAIATQNKSAKVEDIEVHLKFGEYANPSFEAQVETVGKAKTNGIMSLESCVDELYGDTKEDEWKKEEVQRLKAEQGIVDEDVPAMNIDLSNIDNEEDDNNEDKESKDQNKKQEKGLNE